MNDRSPSISPERLSWLSRRRALCRTLPYLALCGMSACLRPVVPAPAAQQTMPETTTARRALGDAVALQLVDLLQGPLAQRIHPLQDGPPTATRLVLPISVRTVQRDAAGGFHDLKRGCLADLGEEVYLALLSPDRHFTRGASPVYFHGGRTRALGPLLDDLGADPSINAAGLALAPDAVEVVLTEGRDGFLDGWVTAIPLESGGDGRYRAVEGQLLGEVASLRLDGLNTRDLCDPSPHQVVVRRCAPDPEEARARAWSEGVRAAVRNVESFSISSQEELNDDSYQSHMTSRWSGRIPLERVHCAPIRESEDGHPDARWCATATCSWEPAS